MVSKAYPIAKPDRSVENLDHHAECHDPENKDGESSVPPASEDQAVPQMPVKKVTRRWAAWTHSEEERFFAALRQVGKNFEKITCHVESKDKEQVRHYYYRLVRRMNKMLSPKLCLDAKDSEDTISAMLRWWALLEQSSCKASQLHLKPRRYKMFIERLENQLSKDRKKNKRKQRITGGNNSSMAQSPVSDQVKASSNDTIADRLNIQKVRKHRKKSEAEPTTTKAAKRRRKTAADKRLETEAIAGVSLVADAAEYLEQGCASKEIEHAQETPGHDCSRHVARGMHSLLISPQSTSNNQSIHKPGKLKLQLFPIDECTQKALEMDHHNPHLELTLSTSKKISSIVEHLNRKWGNSRLLSQELMLFPYWAQRDNLLGYQKWTKDSPLCAADVYNLIGSPSVFRLRYGWFSKAEVESATTLAMIRNNLNERNSSFSIAEEQNIGTESTSAPYSNQITPINTVSNIHITQFQDNPAVVSSLGTQHGPLAITEQFETKDMELSATEWADRTTNISVEDLLSQSIENDISFTQFVDSDSLLQTPYICDSFDADIAAFLQKNQNKADLEQCVAPQEPSSSIWDADEACDAFSFQRNHSICDKGYSSSTPSPFPSHKEAEELLQEATFKNNTPNCGDVMDDRRPDHSQENLSKDDGLTDIYWPDCLRPLYLDIPSCTDNTNDLFPSDSLGGLNHLIANSVDALQSCSLLDKKEPASTSEAHQTASFSDFRIRCEV
ncbi:hypothetical protein ACS0TY_015082 [Phlomoides rotata]